MLFALAILTTTVTPTPERVTPQCEYMRYMVAGVWSALDDAERAKASFAVRNNLENTLRSIVAKAREVCR